jgi:hypothetical protein
MAWCVGNAKAEQRGEAMNAPADWKKVHPDYMVKRAYIFAHGKGSSCTRKAWRVMLTVAEYSTAQYRQPCPDCGREREGRRIEGRVSENHKCGAKCRSSKGWQCECSCGGANHGAGFDVQEPEVTRIPDIDTMRYDAMGMDIGE